MKKLSPLTLLRKYSTIIFFTIVAASFAIAIIYLQITLNEIKEDSDYVSPLSAGSIDSDALESIKSYKKSNEVTALPSIETGNRINPFGE